MRRFIVEVLVDVVLLLAILLLLDRFTVGQPFPFGPTSAPIADIRPDAGAVGFLSWAAVLVLVNRFARPVLVALTGRLLFSTMGFFVVIINAIAIWITSILAPIKIANVAEPTVLWIIVAAGAVYPRLDGGRRGARPQPPGPDGRPEPRGLGIPRVAAHAAAQRRSSRTCASSRSTTRSTRPAWTSPWRIRRSGASDAGSRRVVLGEKDDLVDASGAGADQGDAPAARPDLREDRPDDGEPRATSCRPSGSPSCRRSRATRPRSPMTDVAEIVDQGARRRPGGAVRDVRARAVRRRVDGPGPSRDLAGRDARRGQGPATTDRGQDPGGPGGHPGTRRSSRNGASRSPARSGLSDIVGEFAAGVLKELDYRNEAYHARRLADGMARFPQVHVPIVYDDLSGQRVITMEFVKGIKISKADELRAAGFDTTELGTVFIRAIIKQVLVDGFFHGDPHPGNILGDPETQPDRVPGPRPRRPARLDPADGSPRAHLLDQGDRHPRDRRRPDRPRQADRHVRRDRLPLGHRPPRPPVPHLRQGDVARQRARARSSGRCSTTASGSTAS